jgi:hypothetical protein
MPHQHTGVIDSASQHSHIWAKTDMGEYTWEGYDIDFNQPRLMTDEANLLTMFDSGTGSDYYVPLAISTTVAELKTDQEAASHAHDDMVFTSTPTLSTKSSSVRPPYYALYYIMRVY